MCIFSISDFWIKVSITCQIKVLPGLITVASVRLFPVSSFYIWAWFYRSPTNNLSLFLGSCFKRIELDLLHNFCHPPVPVSFGSDPLLLHQNLHQVGGYKAESNEAVSDDKNVQVRHSATITNVCPSVRLSVCPRNP